MPLLSKRVISNYLRSDCLRRLRLDLVPDTQAAQAERQALSMPPRDVARPGLRALTDAGRDWEKAKVNDLARTFSPGNLAGNFQLDSDGQYLFSQTALAGLIQHMQPGRFLVEAEYDMGPTFQQALNLSSVVTSYQLEFSQLRPDLIQVFSAGSSREEVMPNGTIVPIADNDTRLPLRIIDIKLTAEPSVPYFIEVTLYAMALSGWLVDKGLNSQYLVAPDVSVWPGSHDASAIVKLQNKRQQQGGQPSTVELLGALNEDLEECPIRVMVPRLRRFFQTVLPEVLASDWRTLELHVDNRCSGCDYLGYPWGHNPPNPDHCWSMATVQDHLSRVAFISRGARGALIENQIASVHSLAGTTSSNAAYDSHHTLRATRTVVAGRAQALENGAASIPHQAGTSAVMPAWADLRIYLTADFDIGSGITMAFGISAVWAVAQNSVPQGQHFHRWQPQVFPVDQRDPAVEQRELMNLLTALRARLDHALQLRPNATVQVYIWDSVTYEHLVRVVGRHLHTIMQSNQTLSRLAWLFPPDSLVANPDLSDRDCPITVVREVIRAVVAAPVPHYYSLLNIARGYYSAYTQAPYNQFNVPDLFEDSLSDQVPSERVHEIWSRMGGSRPWNRQLQQLESTIKTKLRAVESVAQRLGEDLRGQLNQTAPRISDLRAPSLLRSAADDARFWYVFTRLNVALDQLEIQKIHSMPPHEREARFKSALLPLRLSGQAEQQALATMGIQPAQNRFVYQMAPGSREVRVREGDFSFALSPVGSPGFLNQRISTISQGRQLSFPSWARSGAMMPIRVMTQVSVAGIDRDVGFLVLDINSDWLPAFQALEQAGCMDLSQNVILDPIHKDFLLDRVRVTLNAIGNPPIAITNTHPAVGAALGRTRAPSRGAASVVADVYWNPGLLYQTQVHRTLPPVRQIMSSNGFSLNSSQWQAWEESLSHRLRLVWGPPGTGKSRTLRAIILGAFIESQLQSRSLRVLVTGPTYESIDNVLLEINGVLSGSGPLAIPNLTVGRLRSSTRPVSTNVPANIDIGTGRRDPQFRNLRQRLQHASGFTLVGATTHQAHKLYVGAGRPVQEMFDLILVDEASQMDVAQSTLALSGLAAEGAVVIAGDPKQLPPIHRAEKPVGLEEMVGPIFSYFQDRFRLQPLVLETNYRSSRSFVELGFEAGYPRTLQSYSPDLKIDTIQPIPPTQEAPQHWPQALFWTPEWTSLLDPDQRTVCFVYREGRSSQWNPFEADAIGALIWLMYGRLGNQLLNEMDPSGSIQATNGQPYSSAEFWDKGVGIVTPHRAQQALIVSRLQSMFPNDSQFIRSAVDTVERFQGQRTAKRQIFRPWDRGGTPGP
jgi:DNA replication ATP-dependent helicase Dna2